MARMLALVGLILVTGCAELSGARLVRYSDTRFYLRHYPWLYGDETVNALAADVCRDDERSARLVSAEQYNAVDIRYATYACVAPAGEAR